MGGNEKLGSCVLGRHNIYIRSKTWLLASGNIKPSWEDELLILERVRKGQGQKRRRSVQITLELSEKAAGRKQGRKKEP